jgi:Domain of unknown function (DUF1707)/Cell wall-active antibiotics response 4TMS YvqF
MTDQPALRASDAEREDVVARLRDASADGRLTLEEFSERMNAAYDARTHDELERLLDDLPGHRGAAVVTRRRPTRLLFALFGSTEREGHLRLRGRVTCLMGFGNIDLDLRHATLQGDVITIMAIGGFGAIDVYVPEGVEVDVRAFALFGHGRACGNDPPPRPGTPLIRVYAVAFWAGIDVWRVPLAWTERKWRDVIKGIRRGEHKELNA